MHYCMGKLISTNLHADEKKDCDKCGMEKKDKNGCCKDEQKQVKIEKEHLNAAVYATVSLAASLAELPHYQPLPEIYTTSVTTDYPVSNAPPRSQKVALFISHCTFLI